MQRPALTKMPAETSRATKLHYVLLAGVICVGLALRTAAIDRASLWTDEALTLIIAHLPVWDMIARPADPTPFLYYALHKWFVPDGADVTGVRSIALVAGMLTLPVVYAIGRLIFSRTGALLATSLVTLSPALIDYSQEARAYGLLVMLVCTSAMFLLLSFRPRAQERQRALIGFAVATVAAIYTHFVAIFWVAPALLILGICLPRSADRQGVRECGLVIAAIVVASIPEAWRVIRYATGTSVFNWLTQLTPSGFLDLLARQWLPAGASPIGRWAGLVLVTALLGLGLIRRKAIALWARQRPAGALIIAALCLQPLALWLFGFLVAPVLMERTMLASLVGVALLLVLMVEPLEPPTRMVVSLALAIAAIGSLMIAGTVRAKEDWRGAERRLATLKPSLIFMCPYWQGPAVFAAGAATRSVPVVTIGASGAVLLSPRPGDRDAWHQAFYKRIYIAQSPVAVSDAPAPTAARRILVSEFVLVTGTCSEAEMKTLSTWFRPERVEPIWQSRRADNGVVIRISRWRSASPRSLTLIIPR